MQIHVDIGAPFNTLVLVMLTVIPLSYITNMCKLSKQLFLSGLVFLILHCNR